MLRQSLLLFFLLAFNPNTFGQIDEHDNLIDLNLQKCLNSESGDTNSGMINCTIIAKQAWDIELNKYYNLLINMLSTEEKSKLKASQKKWLLYRDSEFEFSSTVYHNQSGTMYGIFVENRFLEIVKSRALELKEYYDILPHKK